ncbi:MAG: electron transport complex subunit RsxC [Acidobacteria bacterium]|nr:electron transport complex subunit RsxC [Acidobacteriota bacterium]
MIKRAHGFPGGVHPDYHKELTAGLALEVPPLFERYVVPVAQHIGSPAKVIVDKGAQVFKGTVLAEPSGFVSVPMHSPTSGTVKSVKNLPHPWGPSMLAVEITADGEDTPDPELPRLNHETASIDELRDFIRQAGIVGMGGAAFPTHVKLSPPKEKPIDVLILNGAECEPYLTADHRLMVESPEKVIAGAGILAKILKVKRICIGVEDNKPDALSALEKAAAGQADMDVYSLHVTYPQGAEKQLIYAILGREVPAGGLPMDVGVVVQNVGTASAVWDAVANGIPLIERITTITGRGIGRPGNLVLRIGTLVEDVVRWRGGISDDTIKVVNGGPMMGMAMSGLDVPVLKGSSGLLFLERDEVEQYHHYPCIRCGRCVDICPMKLMPCIISYYTENEMFDEVESLNVTDCIECGSCAYVCPSSRILVHHMKMGKAEVIVRRRKKAVS